MSKDHFYFSRNDRVVALVLLSIIIITKTVSVMIPGRVPAPDVAADSVLVAQKSSVTPARSYRSSAPRRDSTGYTRGGNRSVRNTERPATVLNDTTEYKPRYQRKSAPLSAVDLNVADSLALVSLPGIGPYYARRIIQYRNRLGGFVGTEQLAEIDGLPDSVMKWFIINDTVPLVMVRINSASLNELRNHPYLNFYQARAIVDMRRERGRIKGPEQLSFMEEFTAQDLERLEPYLDFN